jgi:hypothetical protein
LKFSRAIFLKKAIMKSNACPRKIFRPFLTIISVTAAVAAAATTPVFAQRLQIIEQKKPDADSFGLGYIFILLLGIAVGGAAFYLLNRNKTGKVGSAASAAQPLSSFPQSFPKPDAKSIDAEREMEWLRKNAKALGKKNHKKRPPKKSAAHRPPATENEISAANAGDRPPPPLDLTTAITDKIGSSLPIFGIEKIERARPFTPLPISNEDSLLNAIEQSHEEFEEDKDIREVALKVLAAFKTRNSVEAISQIALYDLSSNLRSQAVSILAEFDHESVFETLLLACADPTREVRAAAARGLINLSFDRADAWRRIAETDEKGRICQAARAAIAGDLVGRSLERLTHRDIKYAAEAFAIVALLIKAGEIEEIFHALENHRDRNVKKAILHAIKITADAQALSRLHLTQERLGPKDKMRVEIEKILELPAALTI